MENVIIPIFVSCIMPVMIVWFITLAAVKKSEHKMNVMIKAIESGSEVDPSILMGLKSRRSTRMQLVNRLGAGVITTIIGLAFTLAAAFGVPSFSNWGYYPGLPLLAVGIGLLVSFFFGMKFLKSQIEEEEKK